MSVRHRERGQLDRVEVLLVQGDFVALEAKDADVGVPIFPTSLQRTHAAIFRDERVRIADAIPFVDDEIHAHERRQDNAAHLIENRLLAHQGRHVVRGWRERHHHHRVIGQVLPRAVEVQRADAVQVGGHDVDPALKCQWHALGLPRDIVD